MMSSQKGNTSRTRAQKHKNTTAFKNTLHDTSHRTKSILATTQDGICMHCKEIIEWKIKYKKYKPLTQPATCIKCRQKTVKKAYYTVCQPCASQHGVCSKCAQKKEIISEFELDERTKASEQTQMELEIRFLSERERRTLNRLKEKGKLLGDANEGTAEGHSEVNAAAAGLDELNCESDNDRAEGDNDQVDDCDDDHVDCEDSRGPKVSAYSLFDTS